MLTVDSIPADLYTYELEPDNAGSIIYSNERELFRIDNLDKEGNEKLTNGALVTATEDEIRKGYKQYVLTKLCPYLDSFYTDYMKRLPYVDTIISQPWEFRFKTINVFKSLLDMANMLGGTTVDVRDSNSILHTLSLADATAIMLELAVALKDRYREYSDVRAMLVSNDDGTGITEYRTVLDKYNPPPTMA